MVVTWPDWREEIDVGDGPVTSYIIRFRKSGVRLVFTSINKGLNLTHTFENLEEDTIYEFRVAIVGPNNATGPPSTIQYQRTLCPGNHSVSYTVVFIEILLILHRTDIVTVPSL